MVDKHLRVLIVDPVREQSILVEKMLNAMGYYCIATTARVEEALLLNRYGLRNFDVLIAPYFVLILEHCQVSRFKGFNIRNLFIYSKPLDGDVAICIRGEQRFSHGLPEFKELETFMARLPCAQR
ncbi:hypothetical protein [Pseudomonas sp. L1(2025)]|uniref:hypothetical protein n=1 Tax=Pseudomonas sp. L1(2025) TaxID=3449429 RepID=UPI003F6917C5